MAGRLVLQRTEPGVRSLTSPWTRPSRLHSSDFGWPRLAPGKGAEPLRTAHGPTLPPLAAREFSPPPGADRKGTLP
eukprot:8385513-Alexandrium_andersonii.AAC.1